MFIVTGTRSVRVYEHFRFPAGEVGLKPVYGSGTFEYGWAPRTIFANLKCSDDIITLMMLVNKYMRSGCAVNLLLPYLPYGRNDKPRDEFGFGIHAFSQILNSLKVNNIYTFDTHSNTSEIMIDRLTVIESRPDIKPGWQVIAPDCGAYKKLSEYIPNVTPCQKVRDSSGKIVSTSIPDTLNPEGDTLIVDDLCDGGATFLGCAEAIRQKYPLIKNVSLHITHGIFSKGYTELSNAFDSVTFADTYQTYGVKDLPSNFFIKPLVKEWLGSHCPVLGQFDTFSKFIEEKFKDES